MAERIAASGVVGPDGVLQSAAVVLDGGRIAAIEQATGAVPDRWLVPGFIDLQCNGLEDLDVAAAEGTDWDRLDSLLLASGVTSWCPTLVTAPPGAYPARLARIAAAAARPPLGRPTIAGAHLEGPFLGGAPGAHPVDLLLPIDLGWLGALPPVVRIVTLAPELDGAVDAVRLLVDHGIVVSLGHTTATADQVAAARAAGATLVTHLFNGMSPFHHRSPGVAGAALLDDALTVGLIADLVHVDGAAIALAFRAKGPDRIALVTDAVAWLADGLRFDGRAARLPDGTLAGTATTMAAAVGNVVRRAGVGMTEAVLAASTTPARALGLADRGKIAEGCRADVVALTPDFEVEAVWVAGERVL